METRKLRKAGNSRVLTIPSSILRALGWNVNDSIAMSVHQQTLLLKKIEWEQWQEGKSKK